MLAVYLNLEGSDGKGFDRLFFTKERTFGTKTMLEHGFDVKHCTVGYNAKQKFDTHAVTEGWGIIG